MSFGISSSGQHKGTCASSPQKATRCQGILHSCCRDKALAEGVQSLPSRVVLSVGRSRQRDHTSSIIRDNLLALLDSSRSPFASTASEGSATGQLEAPGAAVGEWLLQVWSKASVV